ncbi:MAG TPA: 4-carboxy-4-hydroxy-2-oxoadipate aldolase/oxaloacetate decarboxylase [Marmoricola sp.]|jgi:4-hydroxy-4-methyl-2-oxoglutarate aldolase|nr:4-carboxy-4-hydroxy-2-oxoadipate aldolase/oxaloacetate decarboxylase [Marmoricola sp.]
MKGIAMDDSTVLDRLAALDAATVHEAAGRIGHLSPGIQSNQSGVSVVGRAVTAECHPGDNLALHLAILEAGPTDILMGSARGHVAGYWGEIMAVAAQARGIRGLVIDGGCRDIAAMRARSFPVWSTGRSVRGMVKTTRGLVNEPIVVGGVLVTPGDYVIADDDGVVSIPADQIESVLAAAEERAVKEAAIMAGLEAGGTTIELMGLGTGR